MDSPDRTTPPTPLQRLLSRFRNRPDSEHEQSLVRVAIVVLVLIYLGLVSLFGQPTESALHGLVILSEFLVFSLVMIAAIAVNPGTSIIRRVLCMLGDMGMITYLLFYYGKTMTPLYVVYLWVSSGYGLRYGNRYLAASTALAAIGFFLVMRYNADWRDDPTIGWSLWIGLIVLPMYIASLLAKLSKALAAAEAANQAKSRFLANMSHEIRTPINGVIGLLELVSATPLVEKQRALIHGAQSSAAMLLHLIENVLDISKIEAGRITIVQAPFDLHALINGVIGMFDYAASNKGLVLQRRIDPDCPYGLIGDELHLRQVLVNLVGNAVKFTEKGHVRVRVETESVSPERVRLRVVVEDTGIGISDEAQAYIFEPFRQEDERVTRRFGGTGLGMSIARQLVELMGGQLSLSSKLGEGTQFTLSLFCDRGPTPTELSALHFPAGVRLISRDSRLIEQLRNWLGSWGVRCSVDLGLPSTAIEETVLLLDDRCQKRPYELLAEYPGLASRDLVLLSESPRAFTASLEAAGYAGVLTLPLERERLHHLLHSFQAASFDTGEPAEELTPARPLKAGRILVADDNLTNQQVTRSFLEQAGHSVTVVADGEEALDALEAHKFDLAILDMMMPHYGGLDVIKLYRHLQGSRSMPFIVLTANVSEEARAACAALGVKYLSKPLRGHALQAAVQQILLGRKGMSAASGDKSDSAPGGQVVLEEATFQELASLLGPGDRLQSLVQNFCRDAESSLEAMTHAAQTGDWLAIIDQAHALKGAALGVGAQQLAYQARALEQAMRRTPPRVPDDPLAAVLASYRTVRDALQARLADLNPSGSLPEHGTGLDS